MEDADPRYICGGGAISQEAAEYFVQLHNDDLSCRDIIADLTAKIDFSKIVTRISEEKDDSHLPQE